MSLLVKILLYIWQLPQNLVGLVLVAWNRKRIAYDCMEKDVHYYYVAGFPGGISLGKYILLNSVYVNYKGTTEQHEFGHTRQSLILGPLYLFVIGIPSIVHAWWWEECGRDNGVSYYDFYTEKWADALGGVKRA